jgi:hypothetical protein
MALRGIPARRIDNCTIRMRISSRKILMPPAVEPMLPPVNIETIRISFDPASISARFSAANPAVD